MNSLVRQTDVSGRPNCRAPDACEARGSRHCRVCAATATLAKVNADPELRAKAMAASAAAVRTAASRAKASARTTAQMADPAKRARVSAAMRRKWADPAYADQAAATRGSPAYREVQAANAHVAWKDPEVTKRRVDAIRGALADPEKRRLMGARRHDAMSSPGVRERMRAAAKATQRRPEVRAKIAATRAARVARRARAKAIVVAAGVAPWKRVVDRALALLAAGAPPAAVIATLRLEARPQ